ncbi:Transcription factor bHLH121 [Senna tora]|uniref:Transcription factor bHLH121 n=1 Tax=Senna tora TaxID=362788 RepID=A0A834X9U7_9FABA|nr:Transcription factor bHLH121 [Senna tora]
MDCTAARKTQKADREKLRRDRLNEQFVELGSILDPDRPKNDKATILTDTIQLLKDLTSQVSKLKDEYAMLTEESQELTQEKNDLREEKASLKSDIESLNNQHQQRLRTMFPWTAMDHSVMMAPPSYPYPVPMPVAIPPGSIPMHPPMQPYPFFANQNPGMMPNPCSTFVPYMAPNTLVDHQSMQYGTPPVHPGSHSHVSGTQDSRNKSSRESKAENNEGANDVTTDLELKTPGSSTEQLSSGQRKSSKLSMKRSSGTEGSSSGRCSSSHSIQDSSSSSVAGSRKGHE